MELPEVFLPSLAAELPHGWTASESTTLRSPSGTEIRVWLDVLTDAPDVHTLADRFEASAHDEVGPIDEVVSSDVELGARSAHVRQFTFARDGDSFVGRIACAVEGERALIASAAWRHEDERGGHRRDGRCDRRPAVPRHAGREACCGRRNESPRPATLNTAGLDTGVWSSIVEAWASESSTAPEPEHPTRWSPAELAVMAAGMGVSAFPTVGVEWFAGLPSSSVDAIIDTVAGSLIARGLLWRPRMELPRTTDDVRSVVEAPLLAELVIEIVHTSRTHECNARGLVQVSTKRRGS